MRKFTPDEIRELGPAAAAEAALERIHIFKRQWVLHFDVDVLSASEMPATYYPAADGLRSAEFAEALAVFVSNPNLAAVTIASYVPSADADDSALARLLDLFASAMAARLRALTEVKEEKEEKEKKEIAEVLEIAEGKKTEEEVAESPAAMEMEATVTGSPAETTSEAAGDPVAEEKSEGG
jgi:hypothetical protein